MQTSPRQRASIWKTTVVAVSGIIVGSILSYTLIRAPLSVDEQEEQQTRTQIVADRHGPGYASSRSTTSTPAASPIPIPFVELTIPHLQSREYKSALSDISRISETATYTEYIATYESDGLTIRGLLTVPKGEEPAEGWPAIVFVHGYIPPDEYQTTEKYVSYIDYLARNGFIVFKIDLRGHGESEGIPHGAYYSDAYVVDTLNAYAALASFNRVDEERIGLWGHSMAGNVVFRSMIVHPDIDDIVIWAGAVYTYEDFSDFSITDSTYSPPEPASVRRQMREELFATYGSFSPTSEFWQMVTPINYTDGVVARMQIHHAINDTVVSVDYTRNIKQILESTNIDIKTYEYLSGGHNIDGPSFNTAMERTVEFFNDM